MSRIGHRDRSRERFATTQWSLLESLSLHGADPEHPIARAALDALCRTYWPPVYAAVRRMGRSPDDASDLTQGFFEEVVLRRRLFERADRGRGRLRSLLMTSLKRYVIDAHRAGRGASRRFHVDAADLAAEEEFGAVGESSDPEVAFDRRWVAVLLSEAMRRVEADLQRCGMERHWRAFELFVLLPLAGGGERPSYAKVASELGASNVDQVAVAIQITKRRLLAAIEHAVAETVEASPDSLREEVRLVLGVLRG